MEVEAIMGVLLPTAEENWAWLCAALIVGMAVGWMSGSAYFPVRRPR